MRRRHSHTSAHVQPPARMRLPWRFVSMLFILGAMFFMSKGFRTGLSELPPEEYAETAAVDEREPAPSDNRSDAPASSPSEETPQAQSPEAAPVVDAPHAEEREALLEELQTVEDRATSIHPIEMPAYNRLLAWSADEDASSLQARARRVTFHDLVHRPADYRGQVVQVDLRVRRVLPYKLSADSPLGAREVYELWGWPTNSRGWLYVVLTPELPAGVTVGEETDVTVTAVGYFFKLQGYHPAHAKPNAAPLVAPLLIGRLISHRSPVAAVDDQFWLYVMIAAGAIIAVLAACVGSLMSLSRTWRRKPASTVADTRLDLDYFADSHAGPQGDSDEPGDDSRDNEYWWLSPSDRNAPPYADR